MNVFWVFMCFICNGTVRFMLTVKCFTGYISFFTPAAWPRGRQRYNNYLAVICVHAPVEFQCTFSIQTDSFVTRCVDSPLKLNRSNSKELVVNYETSGTDVVAKKLLSLISSSSIQSKWLWLLCKKSHQGKKSQPAQEWDGQKEGQLNKKYYTFHVLLVSIRHWLTLQLIFTRIFTTQSTKWSVIHWLECFGGCHQANIRTNVWWLTSSFSERFNASDLHIYVLWCHKNEASWRVNCQGLLMKYCLFII